MPKNSNLKDIRKAHVQKPRAKSKRYLAKANPRELRKRGWAVIGFDTSMSSIAAAGIGYDATLKKLRGPAFAEIRWHGEHYFDRLKDAARAENIVHEVLAALRLELNLDEVFIAQEEPWPMGIVGSGQSAYLKQQAEISGALLGGLLRYGYREIWQINSMRWRTMVADDLEITTHHSKWRSSKLAKEYHCRPQDSGKFRTKQWALSSPGPGYAFMSAFENEIPDWPDLIEREGKIPRPEGSTALAVQPDDRYDALAIMWTVHNELVDGGLLDEIRAR